MPEVNRITNAFISGAQAQNPEVEVKVTFINSWFDPATAKEAALAQIGAGADVLYAERSGVIEAAQENQLLAVGNMADQQELAPENVITSVTWNMTPTVEYVIDQVLAGSYTVAGPQGLQHGRQGRRRAGAGQHARHREPRGPVHGGRRGRDGELRRLQGADLAAQVAAKEADIMSGLFRVDINESQPAGSTIVGELGRRRVGHP